MIKFRIILLYLVLNLLWSCGIATTRPKLEMNLAASAFQAAREAQADKLSPNLFRKAEIYFLKAKSSYKRKYFNKAKQYATLSQKFSEKAEMNAKLKSLED